MLGIFAHRDRETEARGVHMKTRLRFDSISAVRFGAGFETGDSDKQRHDLALFTCEPRHGQVPSSAQIEDAVALIEHILVFAGLGLTSFEEGGVSYGEGRSNGWEWELVVSPVPGRQIYGNASSLIGLTTGWDDDCLQAQLASVILPLAEIHGWKVYGWDLESEGDVIDFFANELVNATENEELWRWFDEYHVERIHDFYDLTERQLVEERHLPEALLPALKEALFSWGSITLAKK